jgi:putative toxin-antitoxin system antitoxin component (TIGR02293 family)
MISTSHSVLFRNIGLWLGQTPESEFDLAGYANAGLPTEVAKIMTEHGLTPGEVSSLVIPARTLKHRRSRRERLSKDESDKAIRTARILARAELVLGDEALALRWMRSPKQRFDGRTPFQLIETDAGSRLVEDMLGQIDEGIFA